MVVVGVGWKCTPRGHEPLHALFNLGDFRHNRRTRRPRHHRRDGRWHGGNLFHAYYNEIYDFYASLRRTGGILFR